MILMWTLAKSEGQAAASVRPGLASGLRLRSAIPCTPCRWYRRNHRYPVGRDMPNSWHKETKRFRFPRGCHYKLHALLMNIH